MNTGLDDLGLWCLEELPLALEALLHPVVEVSLPVPDGMIDFVLILMEEDDAVPVKSLDFARLRASAREILLQVADGDTCSRRLDR